jgi:hypothetical protein
LICPQKKAENSEFNGRAAALEHCNNGWHSLCKVFELYWDGLHAQQACIQI